MVRAQKLVSYITKYYSVRCRKGRWIFSLLVVSIPPQPYVRLTLRMPSFLPVDPPAFTPRALHRHSHSVVVVVIFVAKPLLHLLPPPTHLPLPDHVIPIPAIFMESNPVTLGPNAVKTLTEARPPTQSLVTTRRIICPNMSFVASPPLPSSLFSSIPDTLTASHHFHRRPSHDSANWPNTATPTVPSVHSPASHATWTRAFDLIEQLPNTDSSLNDIREARGHIDSGILIHLNTIPPPLRYRNTPSVSMNIPQLRIRLQDYIAIGAVVPLPDSPPPSHIQPLHCVFKEGKKPRLVIDLSRNLNAFSPHRPFSYSSVDSAVALSYPGCWYGKLDLSNAFLSFPLHPSIHHLFSFSFDKKFFQFRSMPFGLADAPRLCTLLLSVVSYTLTVAHCHHIVYLDDFLFVANSYSEMLNMMATASTIFASFGLVVNADKTEGPSQRITFLGIVLDSLRQTLECTTARIAEISALCDDMVPRRRTSLRHIQHLLGKFSFAARVLPGARPFLRRLIDSMKTGGLPHHIHITSAFRADLLFWKGAMCLWNGRALWRKPAPFVIATDASLEGFGFHLEALPPLASTTALPDYLQPSHGYMGLFSPCHLHLISSHRDIAWAELFAIVAALHVYAPHLENSTILFRTDNMTDVNIINRQSTKIDRLGILLRAFYALSLRHNVHVHAVHKSGVDNVIADWLSRPTLHHFHSFTDVAHLDFCPSSPPDMVLATLSSSSLLHSRQLRLLELDGALVDPSCSLQLSMWSPD